MLERDEWIFLQDAGEQNHTLRSFGFPSVCLRMTRERGGKGAEYEDDAYSLAVCFQVAPPSEVS